MIIEIKDTLVSMDIITEEFCCDLEACKGKCCIIGDAGAPVSMDEVMELENVLDEVWDDLSASAQAVIDKQGVVYTDQEGDLVTSIVNGKDCVFTYYDDLTLSLPDANGGERQCTIPNCCLCATEKAFRAGRTSWCKPISCALYPIRVKELKNGLTALNYHQWDICADGRRKGRELHMPVYKFLREPLIRRFGQEWYDELCLVAEEVKKQMG
ncbi:MAG: DUF3109 family protein [Prevotella sp.]|nr:DUF3109 family protein [Prevotella sp.]